MSLIVNRPWNDCTTKDSSLRCRQSARMSEIKNGGLHQYGTGRFEQQQFRTAVAEGVNL